MKGFRVWSDYWKKYATEADLHMDGSVDAIFEDGDGVPHHENTDIVVEFDTGLKDKNGKPICDGDIAKCYSVAGEPCLAVVRYGRMPDIGGHEYCPCKIGFYLDDEVYFDEDFGEDDDYGDLEVIGNVHENHELLRVK